METTLNASTNVGTIFDLGSGVSGDIFGSATTIDTIKFAAHVRADVEITYQEEFVSSKTGEVTQGRWTATFDNASSPTDSKDGSQSPTDSKDGSQSPTDSKGGSDSSSRSQNNLYEIDRAQFTDTSVAFDLDVSENAGSALALYNAGFNELPSPRIFGQWIAKSDEIDSANDSKAGSIKDDVDMTTLAQSMIDTYAPGLSNEVLVAVLFKFFFY